MTQAHNMWDGPGEVRALLRNFDYGAVGLAPIDAWDPVLRSAMHLMLDSAIPVRMAIGPEMHLFYNDAYLRFLEERHPASLGQPYYIVWPEIRASTQRLLERVMGGEAVFIEEMELSLLRKGRREQAWFSYTFAPIRNDHDQVLGIYGACIELTAQKRLEAELREADQRKDEFLAMLAHELRNPLAPISAAAQLLGMTNLSAPQLKRTSEVISRQVRHMSELVDDLLDVSRVTQGMVKIARSCQDMAAVVRAAIEQSRPLVQAHGHRLNLDLPHGPCFVSGDQKRLVQVLVNLLNNAAKYTPDGGHIAVRLHCGETQVTLEVTDDGIGVPLDMRERIFALFVQAERTPDRAQGGLGLGLALVHSLVELHGGSVRCDAAPSGRGTRFTVILPRLHQGVIDSAGMHPVTAQDDEGGLRVLIVDDNADAADMLAMFVAALGHRTRVEPSSARAIIAQREERFDVGLFDLGLPGLDGHGLARHFRAQPEAAGMLLLAVTGYGETQDRQASRAAGFDHHLVKPVELEALRTLLVEHRALLQ